MDNYFTVKMLLGLDFGNLPVHRGMRQKRYQSIEKMLDLLDICRRIGPKPPQDLFFLNPQDGINIFFYFKAEWQDDMNYIYPDYQKWYVRFAIIGSSLVCFNFKLSFFMCTITKFLIIMLIGDLLINLHSSLLCFMLQDQYIITGKK